MEDAVLDRVTVEQFLSCLGPEQRLVLALVYGVHRPADWPWPDQRWPPTYAAVGWYVGLRFRGRPLSEAAMRFSSAAALRKLVKLAALHVK